MIWALGSYLYDLSTGDPPVEIASILEKSRADMRKNSPVRHRLATCPLPPPENRLPVPIEAGEKIPYERG